MFNVLKNYKPVVQDIDRIKEGNFWNVPFVDYENGILAVGYIKASTEIRTKQLFYFIHKDTAKKIQVMKKPLPKEWDRYKEILTEIRKNTHLTILDHIENLPKLKTGAKVKIPKDFYDIKDVVEKDMKQRLEASGGNLVLQFNLRGSLFENKRTLYARGIEVCPTPDESNDIGRNYVPVSWARVFLYEFPILFLKKIYCKIMNFKNRKIIKQEHQKAKKTKEKYLQKMLNINSEVENA